MNNRHWKNGKLPEMARYKTPKSQTAESKMKFLFRIIGTY